MSWRDLGLLALLVTGAPIVWRTIRDARRGIASESADVILLEDDLSAVAEAIEIGHKTMRVARQSILVGLGLSVVGMVFAAYGMIPPVMGAMLQEEIDVAVIVNALRTSK